MVSCDIFPTNLEYLPSYLWKKKSSAEIGCVISLIAQRLFPPFPSHPTHLIFRISSLICEITKRFHLLSVVWMSSICKNISAQVILVYINLKCESHRDLLSRDIFFPCPWKQSSECNWSHFVRLQAGENFSDCAEEIISFLSSFHRDLCRSPEILDIFLENTIRHIKNIVQKRFSPFYPPSTEICADPEKY